MEENCPMKTSISVIKFIPIISILTLLGIWELSAHLANNPQLFPSADLVGAELIKLFLQPVFWSSLFTTLLRGLTGFVLAAIPALLLGGAMGVNASVRAFFVPWIVVLRSTPVVSIILVALIWIPSENIALFTGFITIFPLLCANIGDGIRHIDRNLVEMAHSFRFGMFKRMRYVHFPAMLPFLFNGTANAMGFGWKAIIIGEVLSQPIRGIGTRMSESQNYLNVPQLLAWTFVALIFSYGFEQVIRYTEHKTIHWKQNA